MTGSDEDGTSSFGFDFFDSVETRTDDFGRP